MKIILEHAESEKLFHSALCNGLDYISAYGILIDLDQKAEYKKAREVLEKTQSGICYEDVLMQMLKNGDTLYFDDTEDEEKIGVTLKMVHERVQETQLDHLTDAIEETGDAVTADVILQTVLFKEIIYG